MKRRLAYLHVVSSLIWSMLAFVATVARADLYERKNQVVVSLPSDIAQLLRERNHEGRGGCPESNVFVHGFHYLSMHFDKTMWFLGAPDYMCETNSFISVIATPAGEWTLGQASEESWQGGRTLAGVPILFQHSSKHGYFLTSEWQVEGPMNFMYHSADGVTWSSVSLPEAAAKVPENGCCFAASIHRLCVIDPETVLIAYDESEEFHASVWSSSVDKSFPDNVSWTRVSKMPDDARCDGIWPSDFIPRSLLEKTNTGAVFEVTMDWAVRIPGPTK